MGKSGKVRCRGRVKKEKGRGREKKVDNSESHTIREAVAFHLPPSILTHVFLFLPLTFLTQLDPLYLKIQHTCT